MENTIKFKEYITSKIEVIFLVFLFFTFFFRTFRYYLGIFTFTEYLTFPMALFYIMLQCLNIEKFNSHKVLIVVYFLFLSWLLFGMISYFFSIDQNLSQYTLQLRIAHFLNFYVVSQFITSRKRLRAYEIILLICMLWNIGFSFWEIFTMQHLPMSQFYGVISFIPTGTFTNENTLASIFLVCSPFLFFLRGKLSKHFGVTILFIIFFIFCTQGVRLALIVFIPLLIYVFIKRTHIIYKIIFFALVGISILYILHKYPIVKSVAKIQIERNLLSFGSEVESLQVRSTKARLALIRIAFEEFVATKGFGSGVGTFERLLTNPENAMATANAFNAHNMFMEVLATEGIIGVILLFFIIFSCLHPIIFSVPPPSWKQLLNLKMYGDDEKKVLLFLLFLIIGTTLIASYRTKYGYFNLLGYAYALMFNIPQTSAKALINNQ